MSRIEEPKRETNFRSDLYFSNEKEDWETPQELFSKLNQRFSFDIDVAASTQNAKLEKYFTVSDDALEQQWNGNVFCNPPYGRKIHHWVKKAYDEYLRDPSRVIVLLIPARTDTRYFHNYIFGKAEVEFLPGRLKFEVEGKPHPHNAPFPSAVIIFGTNIKQVN